MKDFYLLLVNTFQSLLDSSHSINKQQMIAQNKGYLYAANCKNHKDYQTAKSFINQYIPDSQLSLEDSCYYLNNYNHVELKGGHLYSRPSYSFKFLLKDNMKYFHKGEMEYCYHETQVKFLSNILKHGLKVPDGTFNQVANGLDHGMGIYSTKIPEHAQLFAYADKYKDKYVQVILLLRQDLNKSKCTAGINIYSKYMWRIYEGYPNLHQIHLLHEGAMNKTEIQWITQDEKSIVIEAVIVKLHDVNPMEGQIKQLNQLLGELIK